MFAQAIETMTELQSRSTDGITVRLLWNAADHRVAVAVDDVKTAEHFVVEVREGDHALDAFHHPFAYAAWHGTVPAEADAPDVDVRFAQIVADFAAAA